MSIINDFQLQNNQWLQDMYAIRSRWIPAYLLDEPMAGLMRTSSRSESENHFFGTLTSPYLTLVEFLSHFDTAMESQRYVQEKNDHETTYTAPQLKTNFHLEKDAAVLFTRTIFYDIQEEIIACFTKCLSMCVEETDALETYTIKDKDNAGSLHKVKFTASDYTAICSCRRFELYGLLCRHIFYVFRMNDVKEFPKKYVLKRWSTEAIPERKNKQIDDTERSASPNNPVQDMLSIVEQTANRLVNDEERFAAYRASLLGLLEQAKVDVPTVKKRNRSEAICSFFGVSEPEEVTIKCPTGVVTKGRKRIKSKAEIAITNAVKKGNLCKKCLQKGHYAKTCKNEAASKTTAESRVQ